MDIWILVTILLVISIILLVVSFFLKEDEDLDERFDDLAVEQSKELYQLKTRIADLEKREVSYVPQTDKVDPEIDESLTFEELTENQHEQIIQFYSQGYTMNEISFETKIPTRLVQDVVDDYIESR